jgi:Ca-activated chloride channel family protein
MHPSFAHPLMLAGLSALPVLSVLAVLAARRRQRALVRLGGLALGAVLLRRRPSRLRALIGWLGMVALAIGMAGPRWGRDWSQSAAPGRDLVVVVDLSRSMHAEAPSRVERARTALLDLTNTLRQRGGHRLALILFAGRPKLVCPLTHDLDHFRDSVLTIDPTLADPELGAGTRIGAALTLAVEAQEGRARARDILLLSDGDDPARDGEWRAGLERARSEKIAVHCLAVGDAAEGHPIRDGSGWLMHDGKEVRTRREDAALREIAKQTGGEFIVAGTQSIALGEYYLVLASAEGDEDSPDRLPVYRQRQGLFLLPAFVLLSLTLLMPEIRRRRP